MGIKVGDATYNNAFIPLSGTNAGCAVFAAQLKPAVTFSPHQGLQTGFQYTVNDKTTATDKNIYYARLDLAGRAAFDASAAGVCPQHGRVNFGYRESEGIDRPQRRKHGRCERRLANTADLVGVAG